MSRSGWTVLVLTVLFISRPVFSKPDDSAPSSEPFHQLKQVVQTSRNSSSYRLKVHFLIDASDREETITIRTRGTFRHPYFRLRSETPAGMKVRSFGWNSNILHIHPSTDEIVTSDQLGVSSVNRTLLDPFEHMSYILDASQRPAICQFDGTEDLDGTSYRILRVKVGTDRIREVMNEFRNQLKRPLKPSKTDAEYRLFYDEKTNLIRRIQLSVDSEFVSNQSETTSDSDRDSDLPPGLKEEAQVSEPVTVHVEGQFDLTKYGSVPKLEVPKDVKERLHRNGDGP